MPLLLLFTVHFFACKKMGLLTSRWGCARFARARRASPSVDSRWRCSFFAFFFSQNKIFLTLTFPESDDILKFEHKYINI